MTDYQRTARIAAFLLSSSTVSTQAMAQATRPAPSPAPSLFDSGDLLERLTPDPSKTAKPTSKPDPRPAQQAAAAQDPSDMLEPLNPNSRPDDLDGDGLIDPTPLTPKDGKPKPRPRPVDLDVAEYERELAEALAKAEAERARRRAEREKDDKRPRTILVERWYTDECGDFTMSWGGTKTCQPRKKRKWEIVNVDDEPGEKGKDKNLPGDRDEAPGDWLPGMPGGSNPLPGSSIGGATRPPATGPGAPPVSRPAPSTPAAGGYGGGATSGAAQLPDARGFLDTGTFAVRVDEARRADNGDIDVLATFTTRGATPQLIGNGDWRAFVTDADGVSTDTIALYRPTAGALQAFDRMPRVSATAPAQIRLHFEMPEGMGAVRSASLGLAGARVATFPVAALGTDGPEPPAATFGAAGRLKRFEVRYDALTTVGQTSELIFSAHNFTDQLQYAHGTRLQFAAIGKNGAPIESSGRVYAVRGPVGRQLEGVSVLPGQTGRFRVVFDAPNVRGPISVRDEVSSATPALPAAAEPVW